jgi:cytochrome P450
MTDILERAITHDASLYPEPMTFNPSRFIATSDSAPQLDPNKVVFGFGRRVCLGIHFVEVSLFNNIAGILATFDICKALDEQGNEVEPVVEYTDTFTR